MYLKIILNEVSLLKQIIIFLLKSHLLKNLKLLFKLCSCFHLIFSLGYFINSRNNFVNLKNYFKNNKKNIIKKLILFNICKTKRININKINILFIRGNGRFGNFFIAINNAIIFCEFLRCKKIIVEYNKAVFFKTAIFYKKYNFTIEPNQTMNSKNNNVANLELRFLLHNYFRYLKDVNRCYLFKRELLNNLPKALTHPNDLYIYIRGGDIFYSHQNGYKEYPQPPLCFYTKILGTFKFRRTIIISEDKLNPVIPELFRKYFHIKYKKNSIKIDISYLTNSYNIVAGKSSFFTTAIKFNNKLKFLWEYDFYQISERFMHLHYSVYKFPFHYTIYKMNSTFTYRKLMYPWINSPNQRKAMINVKCIDNFNIIRERV